MQQPMGTRNKRDISIQGNESPPDENHINFSKKGRQKSQLSCMSLSTGVTKKAPLPLPFIIRDLLLGLIFVVVNSLLLK